MKTPQLLMSMSLMLAIGLSGSCTTRAQDAGADDGPESVAERFGPLMQFVGQWEGTGEGLGGPATVTYIVEPVLADRFLQWHVESISPPDEQGEGGDTHRDIAMISFDQPRDRHVMRQFLSEGYVNTYVLHPSAESGVPLVFETIDVEGLSNGWRARLTYTFNGPNAFTWHLELGPPDQDYFQCRTGQMTRAE